MALLIAGALLITAAITLSLLPRKSRWRWKLPMRIVAVALMCVSGLTVLMFLFGSAMCGKYEFPPTSSRDGKLTAQLREEDCGATDSFHSSVELWHTRSGLLSHVFGKRRNSTI